MFIDQHHTCLLINITHVYWSTSHNHVYWSTSHMFIDQHHTCLLINITQSCLLINITHVYWSTSHLFIDQHHTCLLINITHVYWSTLLIWIVWKDIIRHMKWAIRLIAFWYRLCHSAIDFVFGEIFFATFPAVFACPTPASYPGALNCHAVAWLARGNFCWNPATQRANKDGGN
jgi:hypothetical protein